MFQTFYKCSKRILIFPIPLINTPKCYFSRHSYKIDSIPQNLQRNSLPSQEVQKRVLQLLSLGEMSVNAYDLKGARRKYQEALQICEEMFGVDEVETALTLHKLGDLHQIEGRFPTSLDLYSRALKIFSKNHSNHEERIAGLNHSLGLFYKHTEEFPKAIEHLVKAADYWRNQDDLNKALLSLQFSLEIIEKESFPFSDSVIKVYELLGDVHTQLGDLEMARKFLLQGKRSLKEHMKKDDVRKGSISLLIGLLSFKENRLEDAVKFLQKGIKLSAKTKQIDILLVARGYTVLGCIEDMKENYEGALVYFKAASSLFSQTTAGLDNLKLAKVLSYIGNVYFFQNQIQTSLEYFKKSLEISQKVKTDDFEFLFTLHNNLGTLYIATFDHEKAKESLEKAISFKSKFAHQGESSEELALLYRKLGVVNANMQKLEEARDCFEKALIIYKKKVGEVDEEVEITERLLEETKFRIKAQQNVELE